MKDKFTTLSSDSPISGAVLSTLIKMSGKSTPVVVSACGQYYNIHKVEIINEMLIIHASEDRYV